MYHFCELRGIILITISHNIEGGHSMNNISSIAEKIKSFRKAQHMSQDDLALKSGINISTIKKYEVGYRNPKPEQLLKIATALGVSINEFLAFDISSIGDVLSIIMRLDEQTDMDITGIKDENGNYIPSSISFSFSDESVNAAIASYLAYKDKKKAPQTPNTSSDMIVSDGNSSFLVEYTANSPRHISKQPLHYKK